MSDNIQKVKHGGLMKSLVTGGNGFIGSAVVRALLARGDRVRVLIRPGSDCQNLKHLPVEFATGDLTNQTSLDEAVKGCQGLFHVGAFYRLWHPTPAVFYQINVEGTLNIMRSALAAGVERIVYTSSIAALGLAAGEKVADEQTPIDPAVKKGHYKLSKYQAELEVAKLVKEQGLPAVIVNPTAPIGPGDIKPTPTGRVIREAALGHIPAYVNTGMNIVHVDDVAQGHLLAFDRGRIGERYILGGENMSLRQILEKVAELTGQQPPKYRLSPNWVLPLAYLTEGWAKATRGSEPMLTVDGVRLSKQSMYFSSSKACEQLGYRPRAAEKALIDAVTWFQTRAQSKEENIVSEIR